MSNKDKSLLAGVISGVVVGLIYRVFKVIVLDPWHFKIEEAFTQMLTDRTFYIVVVVSAAIIALAVYLRLLVYGIRDDDRKMYYSRKGTFGTSREMTHDEFERELRRVPLAETDDFIFGTKKGLPVSIKSDSGMQWVTSNRNVFIIGSQGSKKSQGYIRINILQCIRKGISMYITDPSGDIYRDLSRYLEDEGYVVKVFNTVNPSASDTYDMLANAAETDSIDFFCKTIIDNTRDNGKVGESFFEDATLQLLNAMCNLVVTEEFSRSHLDGRRGTFTDVFNSLVRYSEQELDEIFMLDTLKNGRAQTYWLGFKKSTNTGNTISGLISRLQLWIRDDVKQMTMIPDIDLALPGKKRCAYFCITSDQDQTRSVVSALFFQFFMKALVKTADMNKKNISSEAGVLDVPVHLFLDEFIHLGNMGNFSDGLGTWRKRGISATIVTQSLGDMLRVYTPEETNAIINGCKYNLYMGCQDADTNDYYEKLSGVATVRTKNSMVQEAEMIELGRKMKGERERPTVRADEFRTLHPDYAYLIVAGCHVLKLHKYYFYKDPRGKKINANAELMKQEADEHIPKWKRDGNVFIGTADGKPKAEDRGAEDRDRSDAGRTAYEGRKNDVTGYEDSRTNRGTSVRSSSDGALTGKGSRQSSNSGNQENVKGNLYDMLNKKR